MKHLTTLILILFSLQIYSQSHKIKEYLQHQMSLNNEELIPIVVKLKNQIDVRQLKTDLIKQGLSFDERRVKLLKTIYENNHYKSDVEELIDLLLSQDQTCVSQTHRFWLVNIITCQANINVINQIATLESVESIQYDIPTYQDRVNEITNKTASAVGAAENGLVAIHAREMWAMGYTGRNRIAMNIDTGVNSEHECIGSRFLGHYLPVSQCWLGFEHPYPFDIDVSHFHGTHTMGTMIGLDTATADTIGLAYNAFWIASDPVVTNEEDIRPMSDYYIAFEWAANPDGNLETSNDIPDVINNSWGVLYSMWPDCDPVEYDFIEALEAADCSVIFSAGNEGPNASTVGMPAAIMHDTLNIFSVGALDGNDDSYPIASFSSRGPSLCDASNPLAIKPEVSAPGVDVRSCAATGEFKILSGTSMAGPHVAGAVLLLREAFPQITSTQLKNALYQTAFDLGDPGEDNVYGKGIIDVYAAFQFLSDSFAPVPPVSCEYDLAIDSIIGFNPVACSDDINYSISIKNTGTNSINNFNFKLIINNDTVLSNNLNVTILPNDTYYLPVNFILSDTINEIIAVAGTSESEYNIYNNYKNFSVKRLFPVSVPFSDDFELGDAFLSGLNYAIYNPDYMNTWQIDSTEGLTNNYRSLKMPFAYYSPRNAQLDILMFGGIEIPATGNTYLYFKHAYTQYLSSRKDSLFILTDNACLFTSGETLWSNGGSSMKTRASNLIGPFIPSVQDEWADNEINLTPFAGQTIFLKFIAKNDQGNNLYIDSLRIENGIDLHSNNNYATQSQDDFYPNPTNGLIYFSNKLYGEQIDIYSVDGKKVATYQIDKDAISIDQLPSGVYFIRYKDQHQTIILE
ncbi:MAG: S8 family serine peptidase [Bacteroidales bacterium]|nr:S8 family serine peptidase [Bacteroidales bacterium]